MSSGATMNPSSSSLVSLPGMVPKPKGWKPGMGRIEGICSRSSCTNPVQPGTKLCRPCGGIADVPCILCGVTLMPVPASQTRHQYVCRPCHARKLGLPVTQLQRQRQPARGRSQPNQSRKVFVPLRPAPPVYPIPPPGNVPATSQTLVSIIPYARQFVHRDHQSLFDAHDLSIPPTPAALPSIAELTAVQEARQQALNRLPHYGPGGEILAIIPADMRKRLATRPPVVAIPVVLAPPQNKSTSSASANAPVVREAPVVRKPLPSVAPLRPPLS
ncbi:hypothetical protein C8Q80DRAFT_200610 [Daedaleopsis nitida]|nr:hypothetical protein C8Q80DRAFT_200610 [Daedaleopsis nitida]